MTINYYISGKYSLIDNICLFITDFLSIYQKNNKSTLSGNVNFNSFESYYFQGLEVNKKYFSLSNKSFYRKISSLIFSILGYYKSFFYFNFATLRIQ